MKKLFYRLAVCLCVIGGLVGCSVSIQQTPYCENC